MKAELGDSFEDGRGKIQDLIGAVDAVTWIRTLQGAVRGNHYHRETRQWTYVLTGALSVTDGHVTTVVRAGQMWVDEPGNPHAWKAIVDTDCLVFTKGPRSGDQYESDVYRLDKSLFG